MYAVPVEARIGHQIPLEPELQMIAVPRVDPGNQTQVLCKCALYC